MTIYTTLMIFEELPTTIIAKFYATAWIERLVEAFPNAHSKTRRRILLHSEQHGVTSNQMF